jgi:Leucine-rich repeat (LRR) protein
MLNLSYNQIACIPKDILKLKKLERLDLSFNLLPTLASINPIFQLFKIRKANISISLDGNLVMQEHEQLYNQKISIILE